jgi:hypothetical protein
MRSARLAICHDAELPCSITWMTRFTSRPAVSAKSRPSASAWHRPTTQIWLVILVICPAPDGPISTMRAPYEATTGSAVANAASSPPTMTVRVPLRAPSTPPDTGASRNWAPAAATSTATSRDACADVVE